MLQQLRAFLASIITLRVSVRLDGAGHRRVLDVVGHFDRMRDELSRAIEELHSERATNGDEIIKLHDRNAVIDGARRKAERVYDQLTELVAA